MRLQLYKTVHKPWMVFGDQPAPVDICCILRQGATSRRAAAVESKHTPSALSSLLGAKDGITEFVQVVFFHRFCQKNSHHIVCTAETYVYFPSIDSILHTKEPHIDLSSRFSLDNTPFISNQMTALLSLWSTTFFISYS